jgi:hypothetical protein
LTLGVLARLAFLVELDLRLHRRAQLLLAISCWTPSWTALFSASLERGRRASCG